MKKLTIILSLALCASLPAQARINATLSEWTQQYGYGNPTGVGEELSIPPNQTLTTKEFQLNVIDFFKALPFPATLSLTAGQTPIAKAAREALAKNGLEIPENHALAVLSGGNRLIIQARSAEVAIFQRMVEAFNKKSPMPIAIAPPKLGQIYIFKRGEYVVRATFIGDKAQEVEFVRADGKPFEMNELPGLMRPLSPAIQEAQISPAADVTYGNKDESVSVHREKNLLRVSAFGFDRKDRTGAAGQQSVQEVKKGKPDAKPAIPPNSPKQTLVVAIFDVEAARKEAEKRHPQLSDKGSPFAQVFANEVERLIRENAQVFDSVTWPVLVAEQLDHKLKSLPDLTASELAELITVPLLDVRDVSTKDALKLLAKHSRELDPNKRGVTIILDGYSDLPANVLTEYPPALVTAAANDKTLLADIRLIAALSNLIVTVRQEAIYVHTRGKAIPENKGHDTAPQQRANDAKPPIPTNSAKPIANGNGIVSEQGIVNINPDFVAEVLTRLTRDNRFYRYNQPVKVSLHSEGAKYHASLAAKITEINSVLNGCTTTLELLADNVMDADVSIYVARQPELQIVRRKFGGVWFFNEDKTKKKTIQLLPIESLTSPDQAWREKRIETELIEALGFKSLLVLTPLDKKIIRFGYQFVPSGSDRNEIRALVRRYWDQTKVPTR